jgi:hypothetical protein
MEIPGFELGEKRTLRRWEEGAEEQVVEILGPKKAFKKTLISPAQAEKIVSKAKVNQLAPFIVKPPGAPVLKRKKKVKVEFAKPKKKVAPPKREALAPPSETETEALRQSAGLPVEPAPVETPDPVDPLSQFSDIL